jgi:hypothetical protein
VPELRPEEEWARAVLSVALGAPVEQYDDGSARSMYDLEIRYPDRAAGAVEVTTATHGGDTAFWRVMIGDKGRWIEPSLKGGWRVNITTPGPFRTIREKLPAMLKQLENAGVTEFDPSATSDQVLLTLSAELGITEAQQNATDFPGSIYPHPEMELDRTTSFVDESGKPLAIWLTEFLASPHLEDVRSKLGNSGAAERHAFIIVPAATTAPASVLNVLFREEAPVRDAKVTLPPDITDVWVVTTWAAGNVGFRWSGGAWSTFDKLTRPDS